ncbi:MAG: glycosyltransferase [Bacteroidetes bacterium]|nr:MAG: glycosyltransferase [Bacteroidota bacterium]
MISIIICHRNAKLLADVSQNIAQTIGVPHEIVVVDNSENKYGICQAYNFGASQSKYEILCFSHEDLLFHTQNWGQKVLQIFENQQIGLLGVIGSCVHPNAPAAWWDTTKEFVRSRIFQRYENKNSEEITNNPKNESLSKTVTVDGLWFCCPKKVWQKNQFDAKTFTEFHLYDHDFALQIFQNYDVCITHEILIEHFSLGNLNRSWLENIIKFHKKWQKKLPVKTANIDSEKLAQMTFRITQNFTDRLIAGNFDKKIVLHYALKSIFMQPLNRQNRWFMVYLFKQYFPKFYGFLRGMKKLFLSILIIVFFYST